MKPWEQITPQEFAAMSEAEKRALARTILEEAFGPPANEHRVKIIEAILDANYGPETPNKVIEAILEDANDGPAEKQKGPGESPGP